MTTIQDIAEDLGLSAMTISRALNGHPDVKEETRRRVMERARELNYRPNRWARSLVTRRSHMIGVVIPDISYTFFSEIVGGVQDALEPEGYTLILCNSAGDPERERREVDMLVGSRTEGLIVASSMPFEDASYFAALRSEGVPYVLIDRVFEDLDCPRVKADDREAGRMLVRHLVSLGHKRIAHIRGPRVSTAIERYEGYMEAMRAAGLQIRDTDIEQGGFTFDAGLAAMQRLLARNPRPPAIFGANDPCAMGALRACRQAGLRVPQDVSIVGVGAVEADFLPEPFLTTIEWSRREMGALAGRLLLEAIRGGEPAQREYVLRPSLIVRRSTAPPPS
jgi:LacI family transcriptional regulator